MKLTRQTYQLQGPFTAIVIWREAIKSYALSLELHHNDGTTTRAAYATSSSTNRRDLEAIGLFLKKQADLVIWQLWAAANPFSREYLILTDSEEIEEEGINEL